MTTTDAATFLRTERVPLDELTPFPGNAKRGDVDTILASLRRNGQYRSLVVREVENGPRIVLAGNHTMQALQKHGPGKCDYADAEREQERCVICRDGDGFDGAARCELVQCDDATARRINLVDNRASELGTYDDEALAALLEELPDLEGTGYSQEDLDEILNRATQLPDEGDAPIDDSDVMWGVIVTCTSEHQQSDLLERLAAEGLEVRALLA